MPDTDLSPVEPSKPIDRVAPESAGCEKDPADADSGKDPEAPEQKRKMQAELDEFLRPS